MSLDTTEIVIGTRTCVAHLDTKFDLQSIFLNIKLDKNILGVKYNNKTRGNVKTTGSFFNQLTIVVFLDKLKKETNVKVFSNGKFQISGIKSVIQAVESLKLILLSIVNIRGLQLIDVTIENGIVYNKHDYINLKKFDRFNFIKMYKKCEDNPEYYTFLGERKAHNKFILYGKNNLKCYTTFTEDEGCFIDIAHKNFEKALYDTNGNKLGNYRYVMNYKKKNLILHGCTYKYIDESKDEIYNKFNTLIGERLYISDNVEPVLNENVQNVIVVHSAIECEDIRQSILQGKIDEIINEETIEITNINSNFSLILNEKKLNRVAIHNILSTKYNVLSYYKPESKYQAINVKLYFDKDYKMINVTKNYTHKFTATIFQNGKMMISGCKTEEHVKIVHNKLVDIFKENYSEFIIENQVKSIQKTESNLSIWDLM